MSHLAYDPSDANWAWKIDVSASADGQTFSPVPGLQGVDTHGKWGHQDIAVAQPFQARFLRLRHHNDGQDMNQIEMPATFSVYSGLGDEKWAFPSVGEVLSQGTLSTTVPARSFSSATVAGDQPLSPGAYLLSMRVKDGAQTQMMTRHFFVFENAMPHWDDNRLIPLLIATKISGNPASLTRTF